MIRVAPYGPGVGATTVPKISQERTFLMQYHMFLPQTRLTRIQRKMYLYE